MKISSIAAVSDEVGDLYAIRGRITSKKDFGKLIFLNIQDVSGVVQLLVHCEANTDLFRSIQVGIDVWDIVCASGTVFFTKIGTKTLKINQVKVLSKFDGNHIDKYHGINNYGSKGRVQQIISDRKLFEILRFRSNLYQTLRDYLHEKGFLEFETPVLLDQENTSKSSSFTTSLDAKRLTLFLRKTPEQYLKKLIISGYEAVYEIGKDFRNENISKYYQPEFSVLEAYKAYFSCDDMLELFLEMLHYIEVKLNPQRCLRKFEGFSFQDFMHQNAGNDYNQFLSDEFMQKVRSQRERILLIRGFPKWMSPLTQINASGVSEEFRFYVDGELLAHGNSELTDYNEQKKRFIMQSQHYDKQYDSDTDTFLADLQIGMPPCGGLGVGIDRLVLHYSRAENIRDVIPFPK